MSSPRHQQRTPETEKASTIAPFAAVAAMGGLCCGLPLLASIGAAGAIAGIGIGSWFVVALAAVVVTIGLIRWRRTASTCPAPGTDIPDVGARDTVHTSTNHETQESS
jgi:hypothetical protein